MTAKISVVLTRRIYLDGVAELYDVRDRLALLRIDSGKASEYAFSALNKILNADAAAASNSTLGKVTITIEPFVAAADIDFPTVA